MTGMTGQANITKCELERKTLYHRNRAAEEARRALDAWNPYARSCHEALATLHAEASQRLEGIAILRAEVRTRVG
jgi:hypothetical protein